MSRAQRILQHVIANPGTTLHQIAQAVATNRAEQHNRFAVLVSAQLHQLVKAGKLDRCGKKMAFAYTANARTRSDFRARVPKPKPPRVCKPVAVKRSAAPTPKQPRKVSPTQRILPARPTIPRRATAERETVADFLKRGGRIQQLKPGESSTPLYESVRVMNDRTMRKRLATEADPIDDDALAA